MPVLEISYLRKSRLRKAFTARFGGDADDAACALNLYVYRGWKPTGIRYWHIGCAAARRAAFRFLEGKCLAWVAKDGTAARPTKRLNAFFEREMGAGG